MRRLVLLPLAAALVFASASSAALKLQPVRRQFGEATQPRVRLGTIKIPAGQASGRQTVLVDLQLPPLAAQYGRGLFGIGATQKLNVHASFARAYLARLESAQRVAAAQLRQAIPGVAIRHRYRVLLNGFAVQLPARSLPTLARLSAVTRIYPSLHYKVDTNRSPGVIGADSYWAGTGARGEGVKIGVVDDGVDQTNPYLSPAGFSYPAGFPKGGRKWTTPKIIVARAFPGPGSGRQGRLALYRRASFHGTHVAGIAAGDAGTTAPAGPDHPTVPGLSGIAPKAWIGNYRVFSAPTGNGYDAFTPEIVAAFEAAVIDGMDVVNFSGGGPQVDPQSDAIIQAVENMARAGVVPVIAAGNDRDDFGLGSVGSPSTAPDAISVAAVSNTHVFTPTLTVPAPDAPANLKQVPLQRTMQLPARWASGVTLTDVGSIRGVDRHLCGPSSDPNGPGNPLPKGSLSGQVALVSRGGCAIFSKAVRVHDAGGAGMVLVDNRFGEANGVPLRLADFPMAMVSDLDGARLRDFLGTKGGRARIRVSNRTRQIETGRSGIVTSFSSAGPTDFGHLLKPDLSAPGGQILSSTLPEFMDSPFAVFDGTSMATPHVAGAAALLVQRHRDWAPSQIKSALMSTAGPAWGNTSRSAEAPVLLEGAGLINVPRADNPLLFTAPQSLSFADLNLNRGASSSSLLLSVTDAGGGGTWSVELQPQSASAGATLDLPPSLSLPPGGSVPVAITARASAGATVGDNYGFLVLRKGSETRRIPYLFSVTRPGLPHDPVSPLHRLEAGDTRFGTSFANTYRYPSHPFGYPPFYVGPAMDESGSEQVFATHVSQPVANIGVAVIAQGAGAQIEPWFLGSQDENDVQGYPGTPVDVNVLTGEFRADVGAAGAIFPRTKRYFVSVDSGRDPYTGRSLAGKYLLRSWVNDVTPPRFRLLTRRVTAGWPLIAARVTDRGAGVDPLSLVIEYNGRVLLGAAFYDPFGGLALFPIPHQAPKLRLGRQRSVAVASDYQETKNIDQAGANILPNTTFARVRLTAVRGATVTWLLPYSGSCLRGKTTLAVAAGAPRKIISVRFFDGRRRIGVDRRGSLGLFSANWHGRRGHHTLRAVVAVRGGGAATASRSVRVCR